MILALTTGSKPGRDYPFPIIPSAETKTRQAATAYWKASKKGGGDCTRRRKKWTRSSRRGAAMATERLTRGAEESRALSMQAVAMAMMAIEGDTELTRLIDRDASAEASSFRQQLQRVRHAALSWPASEAGMRDELRALEQLCDGPLEEWRMAVRRARKILGD